MATGDRAGNVKAMEINSSKPGMGGPSTKRVPGPPPWEISTMGSGPWHNRSRQVPGLGRGKGQTASRSTPRLHQPLRVAQ